MNKNNTLVSQIIDKFTFVFCMVSLVVSERQRGNPILGLISNVSWTFSNDPTFLGDYLLSETRVALYLSLKFHLL